MGGNQSTDGYDPVPGNYQGARLEDKRTWYDSTQLVHRGAADPKSCTPNDDPHQMWGWGQKVISSGVTSTLSGIDRYNRTGIPRGLWWGALLSAILLLVTAGVAYGFSSNARPAFPVTSDAFPDYTFPIEYVFPAFAILAAAFLFVPVFRGNNFIAQMMIAHSAGWMIEGPHVALVFAESLLVCLLGFIRTTFPLFTVSFAFAAVGLAYLLMGDQVAKQHTWQPGTALTWGIITAVNVVLWFYQGAVMVDNFDAMAVWEYWSVIVFILFGLAKWLNVTLYIFGDSLRVPNYPNAFYVYTISWMVLYMVEFLIIAWMYIGLELL